MLIQLVQFESALSEDKVWEAAHQREPEYAAIPNLLQKFYLKLAKPNHYGGLMVWDSAQAVAKFRETELAKTVPQAYGVTGAPQVDIYQVQFALRTDPAFAMA